MTKQIRTMTRQNLFGTILFLFIILETALENTALQIYDLSINRVFLMVEIIGCFLFLMLGRYRTRKFTMICSFLILASFAYLSLNSAIFIKMIMCAIIVSEIGYKNAFHICLDVKFIILLMVVLLSLIGVIDVYKLEIVKGSSTVIGYGLGYTHPNRLSTSALNIIFCYIAYKEEKLKNYNYIVILCFSCIIYMITQSRTLMYCMILYSVYYFVNKNQHLSKYVQKVIGFLGITVIPIAIGMSLGIPILLLSSRGIVQRIVYAINYMFNRRFTHIEHALLSMPITLWGQQFDFEQMENLYGFSVIDNGYIRFLYAYGIIGLTLFAIISVRSIYLLVRKEKYTYVVICILVALQGMLENIYVYLGINILIIFWSEVINSKLIKLGNTRIKISQKE